MKTKNKWILEHIEELQQLVYVDDYTQKYYNAPDEKRLSVHYKLCNLLFTMLWITMGANIPSNVYKINDYSVLWGLLDEDEELEIED